MSVCTTLYPHHLLFPFPNILADWVSQCLLAAEAHKNCRVNSGAKVSGFHVLIKLGEEGINDFGNKISRIELSDLAEAFPTHSKHV